MPYSMCAFCVCDSNEWLVAYSFFASVDFFFVQKAFGFAGEAEAVE